MNKVQTATCVALCVEVCDARRAQQCLQRHDVGKSALHRAPTGEQPRVGEIGSSKLTFQTKCVFCVKGSGLLGLSNGGVMEGCFVYKAQHNKDTLHIKHYELVHNKGTLHIKHCVIEHFAHIMH